MNSTFDCELGEEDLRRLTREELDRKLSDVVEERYRPEMRRMERAVLLQIADAAWKDHLLAMDHLRSSVGLVGYAQVDPKVEYKREGMRLFESMWESIGGRVTDLVYRMEQLDEGFVGSTFVETSASTPLRKRPAISPSNNSKRSKAAKARWSSRRSATAVRAWGGTIPVPAAAVRNTRIAACGKWVRLEASKSAFRKSSRIPNSGGRG